MNPQMMKIRSISGDENSIHCGPVKFGKPGHEQYYTITIREIRAAYESLITDDDLCKDIDRYVSTLYGGIQNDEMDLRRPFARIPDVLMHFPKESRRKATYLSYEFMTNLLYHVALSQPHVKSMIESGLISVHEI